MDNNVITMTSNWIDFWYFMMDSSLRLFTKIRFSPHTNPNFSIHSAVHNLFIKSSEIKKPRSFVKSPGSLL